MIIKLNSFSDRDLEQLAHSQHIPIRRKDESKY